MNERDERNPSAEAGLPEVRSGADLRCSDVDRERVADALREAASDGRLDLTELDERLDSTFQARTYGDLQPITRDLPQGPYPVPGATPVAQWERGVGSTLAQSGQAAPTSQAPQGVSAGSSPPSERFTAVLSTEKRNGRWEVPARIDITNVLGEVVIDFTGAVVRDAEVEIQAGIFLGTVTLIFPEGADVRIENGTNVLGERKMKLQSQPAPGGPAYVVRGFTVLGELTVRPPK